jgi:hypothetical protein
VSRKPNRPISLLWRFFESCFWTNLTAWGTVNCVPCFLLKRRKGIASSRIGGQGSELFLLQTRRVHSPHHCPELSSLHFSTSLSFRFLSICFSYAIFKASDECLQDCCIPKSSLSSSLSLPSFYSTILPEGNHRIFFLDCQIGGCTALIFQNSVVKSLANQFLAVPKDR